MGHAEVCAELPDAPKAPGLGGVLRYKKGANSLLSFRGIVEYIYCPSPVEVPSKRRGIPITHRTILDSPFANHEAPPRP